MQWQVLSANYALLGANLTTQDLAQVTPVAPQAGAPSGDGVITLGHGGEFTRQGVLLQFYGSGGDQAPLQIAVVAWRKFHPTDPKMGAWVAFPVCEATATLDGGLPGISAGWMNEADCMAGSIQVTNGYGLAFNGSAYKAPAALKVPTFGCRLLQVFLGVGPAAYANGMWAACDFAEAPLPVVPQTS